MGAAGKRLGCLAVLVAALALAAPAPAATFCVHSDPAACPAGSTDSGGDLQAALDAAKSNGQADTILIFGGSYNGGSTGFVYPGPANQPLSIERAPGTERPTLTATGSFPVIQVQGHSTVPVSLTGVRIDIGVGQPRGLDLTNTATANDIVVRADAAVSGTTGAFVAAKASLSGASIDLPHPVIGPANTGVQIGPLGGGTLTDSSVRADLGVDAAGATEPGPLTMRRVVVEAPFGNSAVAVASGSNVLEDSLLIARSSATALEAGGSGVKVDATNLTLIGAGAPNGIVASGSGSGQLEVTLRSSIVHGFATAISQSGNSAVSTDYSHVGGPTSGSVTQSHPVNGGPGFADEAGGNYQLGDGSPLIDAGEPGGLGSGESPTDLAGAPRILDFLGTCVSRRDIGAYERVPGERSPRAVADAEPDLVATGGAVTFDAAGSCDPDGGDLSYAWSFDDGGSASGPKVSHAFAARGRHTGTVTVTDPGGRSATATATVEVGLVRGRCANRFSGTARADRITGSPLGDLIRGLGGRDRINGAAGRDCLLGGTGNDRLLGGSSADTLRGQNGNDTLSGGSGGDRLVGSRGRDRLVGGSGNDRLSGGGGNDSLSGGRGVNRYSGGAGNDRIDARNSKRERVSCGSGRRDLAKVDRRDRVSGCERVRRR